MMRTRPGDTAVIPGHGSNAQLLLAGAMLLWGLNIPAIKLLATRFDPVTLAALRMLCACGVFALIALPPYRAAAEHRAGPLGFAVRLAAC